MNSVVPINYELEFEPDLVNFTFAGKMSALVNCSSSVDKIILNAVELEIKSCTLKTENETVEPKIVLTPEKKELVIVLPKKVEGKVIVNFDFNGILNDKLIGFYRSRYVESSEIKYLATTQFQAQDACRAFPCWDHPNAKATFDITIITDNKFTAISNMPIASKSSNGNKTIFRFEKTPKMSTYLVYLGVGDYRIKSRKAKNGVEIRFISTPNNESKGEFALDLTERLLPEFENYFGIRYPLPKLDLIAIPDFDSSAMENWGAITFRESVLLYDPQTSSTDTLVYNATTISHELAHQWFGNLVTMKWWNDLWLNESFATFMATKFVDRFYPEWELWEQFIGDDMDKAMELDSLKSSHPIDVEVKDPSELDEIFDAISYEKGGSVLRMLEKFVGEGNFREGLRGYLEKFKYDNAGGDDLWEEISHAANNSEVREIMGFWIKQVGFPLVSVGMQDSRVSLKQERFLKLHSPLERSVWPIPISVGLNNEMSSKLMKTERDEITLHQKSFVVNYGRNGFYRVKYDDHILSNLKSLVSTKQISHIERWAIQYDLFALCMSGNGSVKQFLDFLDAYHNEDNYLPLMNIVRNLHFLFFLTFFESFNGEIRKHCVSHLRKSLERLTWDSKDNEKITDKILRRYVIEFLGMIGDEPVIIEARKRFNQFIENPDLIDADLLTPIFIIVAWNGNKNTQEDLIRLYKKTTNQEEKNRFLTALPYFKEGELILQSLQFALSEDVRTQNIIILINNVAKNPYGRKILWQWLKDNWKRLVKKTGEGNTVLKKIIAALSEISDSSITDDVQTFFQNNPAPGTERTLSQSLERLQIYSQFLRNIKNEF